MCRQPLRKDLIPELRTAARLGDPLSIRLDRQTLHNGKKLVSDESNRIKVTERTLIQDTIGQELNGLRARENLSDRYLAL